MTFRLWRCSQRSSRYSQFDKVKGSKGILSRVMSICSLLYFSVQVFLGQRLQRLFLALRTREDDARVHNLTTKLEQIAIERSASNQSINQMFISSNHPLGCSKDKRPFAGPPTTWKADITVKLENKLITMAPPNMQFGGKC